MVEWFNRSGVSDRHKRITTWGDLLRTPDLSTEYKRAVGALRSLLENEDTLLVISPRGRGKTQALSVAVIEAIRGGHRAAIHTAADLLDDLKSRFGERRDAAGEWFRAWVRNGPRLLVIDEFDQRSSDSEWGAIELGRLIDKRHHTSDRTTVLLSAASEANLASVAGSNVMSRISGGGCIRFDGWATFRGRGDIR